MDAQTSPGSLWSDDDLATYAPSDLEPPDKALAERVYSSRLLGADPDLVLHGGGNTSTKVERVLENGRRRRIIHVKGSGWDLASIEAPGLPGLDLENLLEARHRPRMSDPEMVAFLRANLLEDSAPNPSVETLLHAFLPGRVVDHSHAVPILTLANQPNARDIAKEIYGSELAHVPYVMPGYDLSIAGAEAFDATPDAIGLWLDNHGVFTMGETARASYERMIDVVARADDHLARHGCAVPSDLPSRSPGEGERSFLGRLRQALKTQFNSVMPELALDFRADDNIDAFLALPNLDEVASRGTITPDHVIRVKPFPVILDIEWSASAIQAELERFEARYVDYFERNSRKASDPKVMLDAAPRVAIVKGAGLVGIGKTPKEAAVAADLAVQAARVIPAAECYGTYAPIPEDRLFEMEYWSLEQAKLKGS